MLMEEIKKKRERKEKERGKPPPCFALVGKRDCRDSKNPNLGFEIKEKYIKNRGETRKGSVDILLEKHQYEREVKRGGGG